MGFSVLLFILWIVHGSSADICPPQEDLAPDCQCFVFGTYGMMNCKNILNAEQLIPPIKGTSGYDIFSLNIEESSLMYIPTTLFEGTTYAKIRLFNTQLMALSDSEFAFIGLEHKLEEIRVTGTHYVTTWDWSQLSKLKRIDLIDVNNIGMYSLDNEFPALETLTALGISRADISFIHEEAFKGLPNLKLLVLKANEIANMRRSMIAIPAEKLFHIDLSYNHLSSLPTDMFSEMPSLKEVVLTNNKFETLSEAPFSYILDTLQQVMLGGNKVRCDCRLRWMVGHPTPLYFEGVCEEPTHLRGTSLRYLRHVDLYC